MVQDLTVNDRLVIPAAELQWRFSRASGPGGQGVNTTDSRVELVFDLARSKVLGPFRRRRLQEVLAQRIVDGCLRVVAASTRPATDQPAAPSLADGFATGTVPLPPPPQRKPTRPGRAAVRRRLEAKGRRSALKQSRRQRPSTED